MKSINDKLPAEKAQKETKQFAILSLVTAALGLVLGVLGIIAVGFGVRVLILAKHPGNKSNPKLKQYQKMAIVGIVVGTVNAIYYLAH